MKNLIYYFSGTGNSFVIARQISEHLQNCSLLSIAKELKNSEKIKISKDIERIGIVFPVYAWGMPLILHRFIDAIEFDGNPYIFAVMNYGGFGAGTLLQLTKKLKNKGRQLSAGFGIKMPGNYLPLYGAKPIETQNKLFEQSKKQIDEIVKIINSKSVHKIEKNFFIVNFLFTDIIYNAGIKKISQAAKEFWTNEKCVNCQLCIKICPVNNIEIKDGKIIWRDRCEQCMACIQWCPSEAIELGKKTIGRKRYRHPNLKAADFLM